MQFLNCQPTSNCGCYLHTESGSIDKFHSKSKKIKPLTIKYIRIIRYLDESKPSPLQDEETNL